MDNLNSLKNELKSTRELKAIVSTMKTLAMANVKKYQKIGVNILKYKSNVDMGLQAILEQHPILLEQMGNAENPGYFGERSGVSPASRHLIIVIGSNQGLCGRFNDRVVDFFLENTKKIQLTRLDSRQIGRDNHWNRKNEQESQDGNQVEQSGQDGQNGQNGWNSQSNVHKPFGNANSLITIGDRINSLIEARKIYVNRHFPTASSPTRVFELIGEIFELMERDITSQTRVLIFYTKYLGGDRMAMTMKRIFPLEKSYFEKLKDKPWPTNNIPHWRLDTVRLISDFIKQYLFASVYSILLSSLTAEQFSRAQTLQRAEDNILDKITKLDLQCNQLRQSMITSELLDTVGGLKALEKGNFSLR